jgi:purine nucleoside phosphorylase
LAENQHTLGEPSDDILTGRLNGISIAFLPRHGRGHVYSPSDVPYRANIDALKRLGATQVISISACGSFRDAMAPGILYLWISLLIAPLRAKNHFLALAASRMSQLHSHLRTPVHNLFQRAYRCRYHSASGRHLSGDGRPTVFNPRRKQGLP